VFFEILAVASAASSIFGSISGGNAARRAANASVEEGDRLAEDAIRRGQETARRYQIDLGQLLGTQRARLAAANVDLNQGSAAMLRDQTERTGEEELALIRENARREAFGLRRAGRNQALGLRAQASAQYGQAFESVLDFGANAWKLYQGSRTTMRSLPAMSRPSFRTNNTLPGRV
jgi:hypothetical protein